MKCSACSHTFNSSFSLSLSILFYISIWVNASFSFLIFFKTYIFVLMCLHVFPVFFDFLFTEGNLFELMWCMLFQCSLILSLLKKGDVTVYFSLPCSFCSVFLTVFLFWSFLELHVPLPFFYMFVFPLSFLFRFIACVQFFIVILFAVLSYFGFFFAVVSFLLLSF